MNKKREEYSEPCVEIIFFRQEDILSTSDTGAEWPSDWSESGGQWDPGWTDALNGQQ
jgi:hypothetical protein